jgi:signal peptidase I
MTDASTATPEQKPAAKKEQGGPKEVVEQILIAFILAFIFRWFVCEAFVIPTGSMAPTLLGAHMDFRCPDCGWKFTGDYPANIGNASPAERATGQQYSIRCPNCAYLFQPSTKEKPVTDPLATGTEPFISYGDRILVQRFAYLFSEPSRWDVVVFRSPTDDDPVVLQGDQYQQNYIKRLVGKPGETIMVLDGDVYVSRSPKPVEQLDPADFEVQTKPWSAQSAMWRIVYDDDHRPRGLPRQYDFTSVPAADRQAWTMPWVNNAASQWDTTGKAFTVDARSAPGELRYDFVNTMSAKRPLTDWLGYDVTASVNLPDDDGSRITWPNDTYVRSGTLNPVSDVMLALTYQRQEGDGPFRLKTTKRGTEFIAEITPQGVELFKVSADGTRVSLAKAAKTGIGAGAGSLIEFVSADYRVYVRIDGKEVVTTTPAQFSPDVAALLREFASRTVDLDSLRPNVRIEAAGQRAAIAHVSLWRDVYYTRRDAVGKELVWGSPAPVASRLLNGAAHGWPNGPQRLGKDEFFVLGDNSLLSSDARYWTTKVDLRKSEDLLVEPGRVPERFLLGKAFFVYWPAGYRPASGFPPIVPNAGEIRFIH